MNLNLTLQEAEDLYLKLSSKNLNLDLTRGKPHADQLELSEKMESSLSGNYFFEGVEGNQTRDLQYYSPALSYS